MSLAARRRAIFVRTLFVVKAAFLLLAMGTVGLQAQAQQSTLELTSPLGRKLYALPDDAGVIAAKKALAADTKNPMLMLALSKALAGRRQYVEAIAVDTQAIALAPKNADLLLERGHRELGLRQFLAARKDLEQAVAINPAMADAYYHLGLSDFFTGEFAAAAAAFGKARDLRVKTDMDNVVDDTAWMYACLRRAGKTAEAAATLTQVPRDFTATGHPAIYLRLVKFYQGQLTPETAQAPKPTGSDDSEGELAFNTTSFGVGNWMLDQAKYKAKAEAIFRSVVANEAWNSWGFIGSETELNRK